MGPNSVWLAAQLARISGKSVLAGAIRYALNQWDGLVRFLEDGRWVLLHFAPDKGTSSAGWVRTVNLRSGINYGLFSNFASVLVRPDGYLAHVRPVAGARYPDTAIEIAA